MPCGLVGGSNLRRNASPPFSGLDVGGDTSSKTLVTTHKTTRHHNSEDHSRLPVCFKRGNSEIDFIITQVSPDFRMFQEVSSNIIRSAIQIVN
jgi:hypothetical protein